MSTAHNVIVFHAGADAVVDFDADPRMTTMSYRPDPALFSHDSLHPSDGGYAVLTDTNRPGCRLFRQLV